MTPSAISPLPQFFDRYIKLVEEIDLIEGFQKYSPEKVFSLTQLEKIGDKIYAPEKWTVKDILQHCIDNERIMCYRALRFSRNDTTVLAGYDEDLLARYADTSRRNLLDMMEEFVDVRKSTIHLFKSFTDEMLVRKGTAYQIEICALHLGFQLIGHSFHHQRVIEERYLPLV